MHCIIQARTWSDELFDPSAAQLIANKGQYGMYSFLAKMRLKAILVIEETPDIDQSNRNSDSTPSASTSVTGSSSSGKINTTIIAGGVVGGVIGLALLTLISFILIRRLRRRQRIIHVRHYKKSRTRAGAGILLQPRRSNSDGTYGRTGDERKVRIFDPFGTVSPNLTSTSTIPLSFPGSGHIGGFGGGHSTGSRGGGGTISDPNASISARRPPLVQMPSSYTSLPLSTMSVEETRPRPTAIPGQIGLVALNREASSNTTINTTTVPVHTHGRMQNQQQMHGFGQGQGQEQSYGQTTHHVHTVISSFSPSGPARNATTREGAISPYVLPPLAGPGMNVSSAAEPMTPVEDAQLRARNGTAVPNTSAPLFSNRSGHHLKGSSGSTGSSGDSGQFAGPSLNRKSPPAYYHETRELDLPTGGFEADGEFVIGEHGSWFGGDGGDGVSGDSLFANPADSSTQALSETTLFAHYGSVRHSELVSGTPTVVEPPRSGIEERWGKAGRPRS